MVGNLENKTIKNIILFGIPLTTFAISPWSSFDPINLIKMLVLSSVALIVIIFQINNILKFKIKLKVFELLILFFITALTIPMLTSSAPVSQQFWGYFGRNTGFLTYFSLAILLIYTKSFADLIFINGYLSIFIFSTILMSTYSILQFFKLDPINWNSEIYFGTFGNINFLSAFLGLGSIVGISKLFSRNLNIYYRLLLIFLILTNAFLIVNSRSIQGLVIFLVGTTVVFFLYLLSKNSKSIVIKLYVTSLSLISLLLTIAIFNIGPLSKYLYDSNVQFRQDYWSAGLSMTRNYPLSGIGLDSYGDWYRQFRDPSSSVGDNFSRVSTSAHSIFLDLSSGGGLPLLIAYLLINLFAVARAIKYLKNNKEFNWVFASVLSAYTGYQVYSLISINNIGVAVWGWSLTGLLIGFSDKPTSSSHNSPVNVRNSRIGLAYRTLFSLVLIYLIAYTPFQSDMRFRTAFETAGSQEIISESQLNGNTSIHREAALMIFTRSGDVNSAHNMALIIVDKFPRNYIAWKYLSESPLSEESLKSKALENIDKLEPNLRS